MEFYDDTERRDLSLDDGGATDGIRPRRRSAISAFSSDGRGNFSRTYSGPETGFQTVREEWGADADLRRQLDGVEAIANAKIAARSRRGQNVLSWAYGDAVKNGGVVRREMIPALRQELGADFDGMTILPNGDFAMGKMRGSQFVPTGSVRAKDVLRASVNSGNWDVADMLGQSDLFNGKFTPQQTFDMTGWSPEASAQGRGKQAQQAMEKQMMGVLGAAIKEATAGGGENVKANAAFRALQDDDFRDWLYRGKEKVGEDGKPLMTLDKNGMDVPQYETVSDDVAMARLNSLIDRTTGMGGGRDGASEKMQNAAALIDKYASIFGPRKPTPQEMEIRQMRLDNAVEDQQRMNVLRHPQRLVSYIQNGVWKRGNGIMVDGVVYDGQGRRIENDDGSAVQLADRQENPVQSQAQGAEPGVRGLAGTSAAGLSRGDGSAQPTQGAQPTQPAQPTQGAQPSPRGNPDMAAELRKRGINPEAINGGTSPAQDAQIAEDASQKERIAANISKREDNAAKERMNTILLERLREAFGDVSREEMESGEYDNELRKIAKQEGDPALEQYTTDMINLNKKARDNAAELEKQRDAEEAQRVINRNELRYERNTARLTRNYRGGIM